MIDWYHWRKEIPRSRAKIQQYEETIRELEKELAEKERLIAQREKRIKELEEEVGKLKGAQKKLRGIVFKPDERQEEENKRGAKDGHHGFFRRKPKPEDVTERKKAQLQRCSHCRDELGTPHGRRSRISVDIPRRRNQRSWSGKWHATTALDADIGCKDNRMASSARVPSVSISS